MIEVVGVDGIVHGIECVGDVELHGRGATTVTTAHIDNHAVTFLQAWDDEFTALEEANVAVGVSLGLVVMVDHSVAGQHEFIEDATLG